MQLKLNLKFKTGTQFSYWNGFKYVWSNFGYMNLLFPFQILCNLDYFHRRYLLLYVTTNKQYVLIEYRQKPDSKHTLGSTGYKKPRFSLWWARSLKQYKTLLILLLSYYHLLGSSSHYLTTSKCNFRRKIIETNTKVI